MFEFDDDSGPKPWEEAAISSPMDGFLELLTPDLGWYGSELRRLVEGLRQKIGWLSSASDVGEEIDHKDAQIGAEIAVGGLKRLVPGVLDQFMLADNRTFLMRYISEPDFADRVKDGLDRARGGGDYAGSSLADLLTLDLCHLTKTVWDGHPPGPHDCYDKETREVDEGLSRLFMWARSEALRRHLSASGDIYQGCQLDYYESVLKELGFRCVLNDHNEDDSIYRIYFREDGLMLECTTCAVYAGDCSPTVGRVDTARLTCNYEAAWTPSNAATLDLPYSPSTGDVVYYSCVSAVQALRHNLELLQTHGRFISPWRVGRTYESGPSPLQLARLPANVLRCITPVPDGFPDCHPGLSYKPSVEEAYAAAAKLGFSFVTRSVFNAQFFEEAEPYALALFSSVDGTHLVVVSRDFGETEKVLAAQLVYGWKPHDPENRRVWGNYLGHEPKCIDGIYYGALNSWGTLGYQVESLKAHGDFQPIPLEELKTISPMGEDEGDEYADWPRRVHEEFNALFRNEGSDIQDRFPRG